jgi:hypothetical protein
MAGFGTLPFGDGPFGGTEADPVVGQIYNVDLIGIYPSAVQPGGIGTPVTMPAQSLGEKNGKFFPGCGHSIMSWEILSHPVGGIRSAIICCPLCRYVQRIITPYEAIHDTVQNPYIFA